MHISLGGVLKGLARVAAPVAGFALGGPAGAALGGALSGAIGHGKPKLGNIVGGAASGLVTGGAAGALKGAASQGLGSLAKTGLRIVGGKALSGVAGGGGGASPSIGGDYGTEPDVGAGSGGGGGWGGAIKSGLGFLGNHADAILGGASALAGLDQQRGANRMSDKALQAIEQDYATRAPLRTQGLEHALHPTRPDLSSIFAAAQGSNPFAMKGLRKVGGA